MQVFDRGTYATYPPLWLVLTRPRSVLPIPWKQLTNCSGTDWLTGKSQVVAVEHVTWVVSVKVTSHSGATYLPTYQILDYLLRQLINFDKIKKVAPSRWKCQRRKGTFQIRFFPYSSIHQTNLSKELSKFDKCCFAVVLDWKGWCWLAARVMLRYALPWKGSNQNVSFCERIETFLPTFWLR